MSFPRESGHHRQRCPEPAAPQAPVLGWGLALRCRMHEELPATQTLFPTCDGRALALLGLRDSFGQHLCAVPAPVPFHRVWIHTDLWLSPPAAKSSLSLKHNVMNTCLVIIASNSHSRKFSEGLGMETHACLMNASGLPHQ